ncbi:MAG: hypothetical protein ACHQ4G_07000 [Opitutales bacterium]
MHYTPKTSPSRTALRKATLALLLAPGARAWMDAAGDGAAYSPSALLPRLRARLVRRFAGPQPNRSLPDAPCAL